jgi:hypothetical protein
MAVNYVLPITMVTFNSANLTSDYQDISNGGISNACFMIRVTNAATTLIAISYDGETDHDLIPIGGSVTLNFQGNNQPQNSKNNLRAGTKVYAKGTAGVGTIGLAGYYQPQGI